MKAMTETYLQLFKKDFELGDEDDIFVGRRQEREDIKARLKTFASVVSICGPPLVGKSRLAKQVFGELLQESLDREVHVRLFYVNFGNEKDIVQSNFASFITRTILQSLSFLSAYGGADNNRPCDDVISQLSEFTTDGSFCLLLLDNCDAVVSLKKARNEFKSVCCSIASHCKNVRIVTTSRFKINFARALGKRHYNKKVNTLTVPEAVELLVKVAPTVEYGVNAEELATRCYGLPKVLLVVARMLSERLEVLSPEEVCELLKRMSLLDFLNSSLFTYDTDVVSELESSLNFVTDCVRTYWAALNVMSGEFSAHAACAIVGGSSVAEVKESALIPLVDHNLLEFSELSKTFRVLPFLRTIVSQIMYEVAESDTIRERFVKYFGKCLLEINRQCSGLSYYDVSSKHAHEMTNIRQLLHEAINCQENVYPVFYKVGKEAHFFLSLVAPNESIEFYNACRESAKKFGTKEEESQMLVNYGDMKYDHRGMPAEECQTIYEEAEQLLKDFPRSDVMSELLVKKGWVHYRSGQFRASVRCCERAMEIETKCGRRQCNRLISKILSIAGISLNCLGQFHEAERSLKEALDMRKQMNPKCPSIFSVLNNLGLLYSKWGRYQKGLNYAKVSLMLRRHFHKEPHNNVSQALVDLAYQLLHFEGADGADEALRYLQEALKIREHLCYNHQNTADVLYEMGKAYVYKKEYGSAFAHLTKALTIHDRCAGAFSFFREKVDLKVARVLIETGQHRAATPIIFRLLDENTVKEISSREPKCELVAKAAMAMCQIQSVLSPDRATYWKQYLSDEVNRLTLLSLNDNDVEHIKRMKEFYWCYMTPELQQQVCDVFSRLA